MSFPRYKDYKDSGKDWLGLIPEHWDVKPLKHVASLKGRLGWQGLRADEYTEDGPFLVTSEHFTNEAIDWDRCYHVSPERYALAPEIHLRADDLLMMKDGAAMGKLAYVESVPGPACLNSHLLLFRPFNGRFANHFLFYVLGGPSFETYMIRERTGTTFFGISQESIGAFSVALPPIGEQHLILRFVASEVSKIDALIAEQQRLIELLKEKRQATISHAVTKGLNRGVPMRNSGIEWVGEVPSQWAVCSLGYVSRIETGSTPDRSKPEFWGGNIPWLKTAEVNYELITAAEESITDEGLLNSSTRVAAEGTLLMAMYGQGVTRGRVAILGIKAAYNQACAAISLRENVNNQYAKYFLEAAYQFIRETGNETSQMNLSSGIISKIKITLPPVKEQEEIVSFIVREITKLGDLQAEAERAIELLHERRTAVISAAVTGKIDVRGLVAKQTKKEAAE